MEPTCTACDARAPAGARFCPSCGRPLGPRVEPQAERRPVTVLFADAVGSTAFTERAGDEAAYRFVQDCVALMTATVERHGGTVTQFRGDGVMALFGAPIAHEDSAMRAVSAALELRDALLTLAATSECSFRIGLSTGPVVVGRVGDDVLMDYTAIGDTANVAARMEAAAEPGTVLLSETTWRAARPYVECRPVGSLDVKGKTVPIDAYEALWRRPIRSRLDAAVARGLGPFVGRNRELDLLAGHLDALLEGRGHVVEVVGEPGIGKSRLLLELRAGLPVGVDWVEGHCSATGSDTPYLPIADLLRHLLAVDEGDDPGTIASKVDGCLERATPYLKYLLGVDPGIALGADARMRRVAILDAVRDGFADAARQRPRVLVVEDLHWTDAASMDALAAIADIVPTVPLLMLTTCRPGRPSPFERHPHSRVTLDGISDHDAALMTATALAVHDVPSDVAELISTRAEGNPLFVEELAATLVETGLVVREGDGLRLVHPAESIDVPDTLQDVILARIDRLAREAREALQLAAVIGREFTVRLLDRLAGLPDGLDDALDELRSVELIRQKAWFPELAYLFKHALTHEVTYGTLLDERRRALHRLVAEAIEDVYADRVAEHVERLAHHWLVAEDWPKALDHLEHAARRAASAFANREARTFYEQAIEVAMRIDPARAPDLGMRLGDVHFATGDVPAATETYGRVADLARELGDHETLAWALAYRGLAYCFQHDLRHGEPCMLAALDVDRASTAPRLYAAASLSAVRTLFGRHDEVAEVNAVVADLASVPPTHPRAIAGLQTLHGLVPRWRGDLQAALDALMQDVLDPTDFFGVQTNMWERGMTLGEIGRYDESLTTLADTIERSAQGGELLTRARCLNTVGWIRGDLGDHASALAWNERCLAFLREIDIPDEEVEANARVNIAEVHLVEGRLDDARPELDRVAEICEGRPLRGTWLLWRYTQRLHVTTSALLIASGAANQVGGRLDECIDLATESGSRKYLGKAARVRARQLVAARELEEAAERATYALDTATAIGHPPEQWRSLALLGDIAAARGAPDEAREHRVAADRLLADVDASLSDAGAKAGVATLRAALR